jgi:hypothetical protein
MQDLIINVNEIEELQTIKNIDELDKIFTRAQRTVIGGGTVQLIRKEANGQSNKFDEITTEDDLAAYKKSVFKYLE